MHTYTLSMSQINNINIKLTANMVIMPIIYNTT